jgi:hypothetical protein
MEVVSMPSSMSLRVGDDLLTSARLAADATGRSAAQQIGYWAKLGRELERSEGVSVREINEVLAGARSYDDLTPKGQAIVRAEWSERAEARRAALDLAADFASVGRSWVEMAPDGTILRVPAGGAADRPSAKTKKPAAKKPTARTKAPAAKKRKAASSDG